MSLARRRFSEARNDRGPVWPCAARVSETPPRSLPRLKWSMPSIESSRPGAGSERRGCEVRGRGRPRRDRHWTRRTPPTARGALRIRLLGARLHAGVAHARPLPGPQHRQRVRHGGRHRGGHGGLHGRGHDDGYAAAPARRRAHRVDAELGCIHQHRELRLATTTRPGARWRRWKTSASLGRWRAT